MTIVVTGGTGQLGSLIVEGLIAQGVPPRSITAIGRDTAALGTLEKLHVTAIAADYDDRASLDAAFAGADAVMFVSGSEVGRRIAQHTAVVEAAQAARVGRIVYTSAPHADTSTLPMAPEHKFTEELIIASGIPFTILRNNWYTENYLGTLLQADRTNDIEAGWNDGRIASASRIDYAAAAVAVLTADGHESAIYELSGDVAWDGDDLAAAATELLGHKVMYSRRTSDELGIALTTSGVPPERSDFIVAMDNAIRHGALGDATHTMAALIGRPTTPLREGLAAALATST